MVYHSPCPFEVGTFDVETANSLAHQIVDGKFHVHRELNGGRLVIDSDEDKMEILDQVGFYNAVDDETILRNRVYAQELSEIFPQSFIGLPWHIDVRGKATEISSPIGLNFGSSLHPTQYVYGDVDLTEAKDFASRYFDTELSPARVLNLARELSVQAIELALESGNANLDTMEPGILYRIQPGTIHRMQPFDLDLVYPPRFCIEQYFKPESK